MNISTALLAIIGIAFIFQLMSPAFTETFWFEPELAFQEPWRFVTSMFLHGGFEHIFFNGFALFLFGSVLERKISAKEYLILFFAAGLIGGILYQITYILGIIGPVPALGASGAIYGILGATAIMLPEMRVFVMFIPMKMKYAAVMWFIISFMGTVAETADGIGHAAHLGGLVFGLAFAWYLKRKEVSEYYMPPDNPEDRWSGEVEI